MCMMQIQHAWVNKNNDYAVLSFTRINPLAANVFLRKQIIHQPILILLLIKILLSLGFQVVKGWMAKQVKNRFFLLKRQWRKKVIHPHNEAQCIKQVSNNTFKK